MRSKNVHAGNRHAHIKVYTIITKLIRRSCFVVNGSSVLPTVEQKTERESGLARLARGPIVLVSRITDHGEEAFVVLTGGATDIGVKLCAVRLGRCEQKAHIVPAAVLVTSDRIRTDLAGPGQDPEVGVGSALLSRFGPTVRPSRPCAGRGTVSCAARCARPVH